MSLKDKFFCALALIAIGLSSIIVVMFVSSALAYYYDRSSRFPIPEHGMREGGILFDTTKKGRDFVKYQSNQAGCVTMTSYDGDQRIECTRCRGEWRGDEWIQDVLP